MKLMKIVKMALAGVVFVLCGTSVAQAAPEFYVSITGAIQGPFNGEVIEKGIRWQVRRTQLRLCRGESPRSCERSGHGQAFPQTDQDQEGVGCRLDPTVQRLNEE